MLVAWRLSVPASLSLYLSLALSLSLSLSLSLLYLYLCVRTGTVVQVLEWTHFLVKQLLLMRIPEILDPRNTKALSVLNSNPNP